MSDLFKLKFKAHPGIAIRRIRGEMFFITPATAELHSLNEIGVQIWDLLMAGRTAEQVAADLLETTDGSAEEIRGDLQELIQTLLEKGIVEVHD